MLVTIILGYFTYVDARIVPNKVLRVYKGTPDTNNEFPFAMSLQRNTTATTRFCTGSLIEPRFVLTAAHCLRGFNPEKISSLMLVAYGEYTKNETTLYTKVLKIYPHPLYSSLHLHPAYDIALVFVEKELKNDLAILGAFDFKSLFGLPVKYAGFGDTTKDFRRPGLPGPFSLQMGEGVVVPCEPMRPKYSLLCVAPKCLKKDEQARPGDSGGPLMYAGRVVGVARSIRTLSSDYTPVGAYLDWINNTMRSVNKQFGRAKTRVSQP